MRSRSGSEPAATGDPSLPCLWLLFLKWQLRSALEKTKNRSAAGSVVRGSSVMKKLFSVSCSEGLCQLPSDKVKIPGLCVLILTGL